MDLNQLRSTLSNKSWKSQGFDSPREYLKTQYGLVFGGLDEASRVQVARELYEDGFASSVVAAVLDVSVLTAKRYINLAEPREAQNLTGLDGANRSNPRHSALASRVSTARGRRPVISVRYGLSNLDKAIFQLEESGPLSEKDREALAVLISKLVAL